MNNTQYETTARFNRGQYQGYSSLKNTTNGGKPAERCVPSMGVQTVPLWKSLGYDSLTHVNTPDGDNYFKINKAYSTPCVNYQFRNCKGQVNMKEINQEKQPIVVEGFAYTF